MLILAFMISNCLIFVLFQWVRKGGYVIIRESYHGWFPHFLWSSDLKQFHQFTPNAPTRRLFPPLFFRESSGDLEPRAVERSQFEHDGISGEAKPKC